MASQPKKAGTTAKGLGYQHRKARAQALAMLVEGAPCPYCGRPMKRAMKLDLDHAIPRAYGGTDGPTRLAHAYCNRRAGALIGNRSPLRKVPSLPRAYAPKRKLPKW